MEKLLVSPESERSALRPPRLLAAMLFQLFLRTIKARRLDEVSEGDENGEAKDKTPPDVQQRWPLAAFGL